jgi:membrane-associated phospholipid phosphatase
VLDLTAAALTEIGNLAIVAPGVLGAIFVLWSTKMRQAASAWSVTFFVIFVLTVILKTISDKLGDSFVGTPFHLSHGAPSGHMAMSMAGYGGLAVLCLVRGRGVIRALVPIIAVVVIVTVGVTRVLVHAHTPADVMTATVVSAGPLAWLAKVVADEVGEAGTSLWPPTIVLVTVSAICYCAGLRFSSSSVF